MTESESNVIELGEAPFPSSGGKIQVFVSELPSVGKNKYHRLVNGGFDTLNSLYQASEDDLTGISGIGPVTARNIKIAVGNQLMELNDITDARVANMSIEEIKIVYNVERKTAQEIQEQFQKKVSGRMKHISE